MKKENLYILKLTDKSSIAVSSPKSFDDFYSDISNAAKNHEKVGFHLLTDREISNLLPEYIQSLIENWHGSYVILNASKIKSVDEIIAKSF